MPDLAVEGKTRLTRWPLTQRGLKASSVLFYLLRELGPQSQRYGIMLLRKGDLVSILRPAKKAFQNMQRRLAFQPIKRRSSTRLSTQPRLSEKT